MTARPSDPDGWYDPDAAPVPEGMETTAEERAKWSTAVGRAWGMSPENIGSLVRDLDRALVEVARLTAINAELCAVNLRHAEALAIRETKT